MQLQNLRTGIAADKQSPTATDDKRRDMAVYAADFILELRNMARGEGFKTLQSILELAYYEASALANPVVVTEEERARVKEMEKAAKLAEAAA